MADNPFNISGAGLEDGTLDFYTLIQESPNADADTLRAKIQALYTEAQANRDHRNLNKRREYQTLLDWLPRAKSALLEPEKRARYNAYLASARSGTATEDFETFMNDLLGQNETLDEKTGLLGIQDRPQEPRARVIKVPSETSAAPPSVSRPPAPAPGPPATALMGALGGFLLGAAIGYFVLHGVPAAFLLGMVVAVVGFVALNRQPRGGIRS